MDTAQPKGTRRRDNAVLDGQLALPLFEPLVEHGLQQIHVRPWVGDEEKIRRGRRPAPAAWDNWPYVETHPAHTYAGLFFDIDKPDRWEYEVDGPCPNWQIRKDGLRPTYHVAYTLEIPVARHDAAQYRIIQYYRDIYDGLSLLFGADCQGRRQNDSRWAARMSRLFAALRGQPARARCRPALHTKGPEGATARQRRSERTRQIHQPQGGRHPDQLAESSHPKGKRGPSGITSAAPLKPNGGLPPWKPTGTPLPEGDPHGYKTQRLPTQTHRP